MRNCLIFLIDESSRMHGPVARAMGAASTMLASIPKGKSESVATAVNSLLAKLHLIPDLDVGLIGYREDADGSVDVAPRWPAPLAEKELVRSSDLGGNEALIEQRPRKIPLPDGSFEQQVIDFPIWYVPSLGDGAPRAAAFRQCGRILDSWAGEQGDSAGQAVIIHVMGEFSDSDAADDLKQELDALAAANAKPTVVHVQLGSHDNVPATLFPANRAFVPQGNARTVFDLAGELPDAIVAAVRGQGINVQAAARGFAFNARMIDFRQLCDAIIETLKTPLEVDQTAADVELVTAPGIEDQLHPSEPAIPTADGETPDGSERVESEGGAELLDSNVVLIPYPDTEAAVSAENPCLVVFVLDRSVENLADGSSSNVCTTLSERLADAIGWLNKIGRGAVDVALVAYGAQADGTSVVDAIQGESGAFVRDTQLEAVAMRAEDHTEERSDGVGGIISLPRRHIYLAEFQPAQASSVMPAMVKTKEIIDGWRGQQPSDSFPATVIHLTRGKADPEDLKSAVEVLGQSDEVVVYHFVLSESEHITVALPEDSDRVDQTLHAYWECSSLFLLSDQLAEIGKTVSPTSRGLVINGDLPDLLQPVKYKLSQWK